eukprot:327259-Chlamydomonas_euryale.AAC.1
MACLMKRKWDGFNDRRCAGGSGEGMLNSTAQTLGKRARAGDASGHGRLQKLAVLLRALDKEARALQVPEGQSLTGGPDWRSPRGGADPSGGCAGPSATVQLTEGQSPTGDASPKGRCVGSAVLWGRGCAYICRLCIAIDTA